ncbi:hypothetical protein [Peterkaempfera sp. SMS 1(5)a]|uniref:hypothetical protein n=1 Tax=Peterkaempfera podocarpi TaxID=3232308 RepID=UPI00366C5ABF
MPESVPLPDALLTRINTEAARTFGGDTSALVAAALDSYLATQDTLHTLDDRYPAVPGETAEARLGRAMAAAGVSTDTLRAMGDTLTRVSGGIPGYRQPGTPQQHLQTFINWATSNPTAHQVGCVLATIQPAAGAQGAQRDPVVSYARGFLTAGKKSIAGDLNQYFSDRNPKGSSNPFDPGRLDRTGVSLAIDDLTGLITVELVAHTWGDARQRLRDIHLQDGVLVASGASIGNQTASALYSISLSTVVVPG